MQLTQQIADWSKDPSTKVGALAIDQDRRIISTGYNGFPKGVADSRHRLESRAFKYDVIIHAEENLILNAVRSLKHATIYTYPMGPCPRCASKLIQLGINRVVSISPTDQLEERWGDGLRLANLLYEEVGVKYDVFVPESVWCNQ